MRVTTSTSSVVHAWMTGAVPDENGQIILVCSEFTHVSIWRFEESGSLEHLWNGTRRGASLLVLHVFACLCVC